MLEEVVDLDEGIYASAFIPHRDIEFAVEDLDRIGSKQGIVAGQNWMTTDRLWGEYEYDPVFEKLVELELPLQLHIKKLSTGPQLRRMSMTTQVEKRITSDGYAALANVINMIMTGVFNDFPELQVLVQEAGVMWIPYVAWRADDLYQSYTEDLKLSERFHDKNKECLERMPSEYLFENFSVTTQPISIGQVKRRSHIKSLLDVYHYEDMFLYSSDWLHGTVDPVDWVFDYPIEAETRHAITRENALDLLRFPE